LLPACVSSAARQGPLPTRNQHPAQLTVLHLDPARAATLAPGDVGARAGFAYTNMFLSGNGSGNAFTMDGELLRAGFGLRAGVADGLEAGCELPVYYTTGGFLDSFLIEYHDWLGLPDQNRDLVPKNQFQVAATYQGQQVFGMQEDELGLGDVPVSLTWSIQPPAHEQLGIALRAGIELPTGDLALGFGNGELDYAGGLLLELPLTIGSFYGHAQHTFAGSPDAARAAGFEFDDVTSFGLGFEGPLSAAVNALVQVEFETSTLRGLDFDRVSREQILLWIGARWHLGEGSYFEAALGEDLRSFVSPDVTFWLGVSNLPGG
jgi:hypothetical protein